MFVQAGGVSLEIEKYGVFFFLYKSNNGSVNSPHYASSNGSTFGNLPQ
jgi:hypothetical protein